MNSKNVDILRESYILIKKCSFVRNSDTHRGNLKNKGITLIALVITIILLLILAGIAIVTLTGNGLFGKSKLAKYKYTESEVREKIELLLNEYQMEKVDNENLSLYEYFNQKKEKGEIDSLKHNEDGTIKVGLDGYSVTINIEKLTITGIEITNDIEFSYELETYENSKFKILIKITDKTNGIQAIQFPDGDILKCDGQEEVEIDYEVEEEVEYVFVAKSINGVEKRQVIEPKKLNLVNEENPYYIFEAKADTNYLIQCYGAQGGSYSEYNHGGYGGYSYGIFTPNKNTMLYIYKGGMGIGPIACATIAGGYNGGGSVPRLGR